MIEKVEVLTEKQPASRCEVFARDVRAGQGVVEAANAANLTLFVKPPVAKPYVYVLVNPEADAVIYVGKGRSGRMHSHVKDVRAGRISGHRKYVGIKRLLERGVTPVGYCVAVFETDEEALIAERKMIRLIGREALLNSLSGCVTQNEIAAQRASDTLSRLRPKSEWLPWAVTALKGKYTPEWLAEMYDEIVKNLVDVLEMARNGTYSQWYECGSTKR